MKTIPLLCESVGVSHSG